MPASHFDVKAMTGRPKFIVRHSIYHSRLFQIRTIYESLTFLVDSIVICHNKSILGYNSTEHCSQVVTFFK
jgi:hypothetical protein